MDLLRHRLELLTHERTTFLGQWLPRERARPAAWQCLVAGSNLFGDPDAELGAGELLGGSDGTVITLDGDDDKAQVHV